MKKKKYLFVSIVLAVVALLLIPQNVFALNRITVKAQATIYMNDGKVYKDVFLKLPKSTAKKISFKVRDKKYTVASKDTDYLVVNHRKSNLENGHVLKYSAFISTKGKQKKATWMLLSGGKKEMSIWEMSDEGFGVTKDGSIWVVSKYVFRRLFWKEGDLPREAKVTWGGNYDKEWLKSIFAGHDKSLKIIDSINHIYKSTDIERIADAY
ncbi:MAG: hypothetical protein ACOYJF_10775 [Prevotella sp.]|jgi:hypothetical protein